MAGSVSRLLPVVIVPAIAVVAGVWLYRDANRRGHGELAPFLGAALGLVILAGSVPSLLALAVSARATTQGFPTALRIVPGIAVLGGYLFFRDRTEA